MNRPFPHSRPIDILDPKFDFWIIGFVAGLTALLLIFAKRNPATANVQSIPVAEASHPANTRRLTVAGNSFNDPSQAERSIRLSQDDWKPLARQLPLEWGGCDSAAALDPVYFQCDKTPCNDRLSSLGRVRPCFHRFSSTRSDDVDRNSLHR